MSSVAVSVHTGPHRISQCLVPLIKFHRPRLVSHSVDPLDAKLVSGARLLLRVALLNETGLAGFTGQVRQTRATVCLGVFVRTDGIIVDIGELRASNGRSADAKSAAGEPRMRIMTL